MTFTLVPLLAAATMGGSVLEIDEGALQFSTPAAWDRVGEAIAVDAGLAVVGTRWDDTQGADAGAAYIFEHTAGSWTQVTKLYASDANAVDQFGSSVAISGNTVVVGTPTSDGVAPNEGAAYVFVFNGSFWQQQFKLKASDRLDEDRFGSAVGIDGDLIAVGAMGDDDQGDYSGSAYIFTRSGTVWSEQAKLLASNGSSHSYFGTSIAVDQDTVLVGAPGTPYSAGGGYVYVDGGGTWAQQGYLVDPGMSWYEDFGHAVALEGDTAVIGSPFATDNGVDSGSVSVFNRVGTNWSHTQRLLAGEQFGELGSSVALEGSVLAAGAPGDHQLGADPLGAVYLFSLDGGTWGQAGTIQPVDLDPWDEYGAAVALGGDSLIVGIPGSDATAVNAGGAHAYQLVPGPALYCFGDGVSSPCPCGNVGGEGEGCANSTAVGATLTSFGVPGIASDALTFDATGLVPGQAALLFVGTNTVNGGVGIFFGDGLRCAGGAIIRLGVKAPDGTGAAHWGPDLISMLGVSPADVRRFQAWYRDPVGSPCGSDFNLSNGVEVYFIP